ncbi:CDP-diacylglycerol--glycerol-3-phosphate 3-phosphatidyltransferase [Gleimia sp. 6138-11-ORH1]|uniref:CDP-diacylglycerol--glycerol-3-phosphate 3-phosphatidyltransferase n=1 Tax=Gleimia sp. 6138-11-ORH1 TaxID=2973937 RepID=UPI002168D0EF|nr:CDP-diacylglycerol--glycerol-3-phosphate 3-phosphatidyltransferase [Gleimia sp. 6138-11-ORH1]MCS4484230.1 CDP-diacylglycerol--glycerol-3-phosphate 3-phosphatidyltransferase [Gleimia sp. 6138-11-ORH1]
MQSIKEMDNNVSKRKAHEVILNVPNILTIIRLVLIPFLIYFLLQTGTRSMWIAFGIFAAASMTDYIDGEVARRWGLITDFGKIWDPIADKALTLGAFATLSYMGLLPWWFTVIVAAREFYITWLRKRLLARGVVVSANFSGKAKTMLQMMLIAFLIVPWGSFVDITGVIYPIVYWTMVIATLALTLYSGWSYLKPILDKGVPKVS